MYTQNTPVHVKLWHRDFWLMATANLLVTMAMYIQLPLLPGWLMSATGCTPGLAAVAVGAPGVGIFALGCFCSYLVQRYRRNMVCIFSVLVLAVCLYLLSWLDGSTMLQADGLLIVTAIRFVQGAVFGLGQMVLSSTLIIDTCESFQRTEANHSAAWFSRLALALGPLVALVLVPYADFGTVMIVGAGLCVLAVVFIFSVKFPFKAPEDVVRHVAADRFFLSQGKWLFINLLLVTTVVGMLLSIEHDASFYAMMILGFFLALLAGRFVFVNADLKSEITTGLIFMLAALLLMLSGNRGAATLVSPVLIGCGVGIIGARFLLFFIKLSPHCRRGTSQSTFFLGWELGLSLGMSVGYGCTYGDRYGTVILSIVVSCLALIMYLGFTHNWYVRHKNR